MNEIIFIIEESEEGGFEARALDHSTLPSLCNTERISFK